MDLPAIVMDNGTGFTKLGYAGNMEPAYQVPTVLSQPAKRKTASRTTVEYDDYDYYIGDEAFSHIQTHKPEYILRGGMITDWELIEKYWHKSFYHLLRAEPQNHNVVLTEPPMNTPENREQMAEIMFETFDVNGLFIGVQAVLALYAGIYASKSTEEIKGSDLTGTVVDSGDGVTHVIPIADGFPIPNAIKHIPIAGRNVTEYVMQALIDRKEPIPERERKETARIIKENYCYCCPDIFKQFEKFDKKEKNPETGEWEPYSKLKEKSMVLPISGKRINLRLGYEQFMGPEIFFHPEFVNKDFREPVD